MNGTDDSGKAPGAAGTAGDAGAAEATGASEPGDEERARAIVDELRRLKVEDLALDMTVSLVTIGYQKLGLTAQTRELRDLGGAHLAIELLRALLDVLQREGAEARLGDLRSTLATMQLEYARAVTDVGKVAESGAPKGGAAEGGATEGAAGGEGHTPRDPSS